MSKKVEFRTLFYNPTSFFSPLKSKRGAKILNKLFDSATNAESKIEEEKPHTTTFVKETPKNSERHRKKKTLFLSCLHDLTKHRPRRKVLVNSAAFSDFCLWLNYCLWKSILLFCFSFLLNQFWNYWNYYFLAFIFFFGWNVRSEWFAPLICLCSCKPFLSVMRIFFLKVLRFY